MRQLICIIIALILFWIITLPADASKAQTPVLTLQAAYKAGLERGRAERDAACEQGDLRTARANP